MKLLLVFILVIAAATLLWIYGERTVKTLYLIFSTSPYEQTVPGGLKVLVLGDSTGYGTGVSETTNSIAGRIGKSFPSYSIENNSVNGRTIGELVEVTESVTGKYELILLQIGGNDILQKRDIETVETELRSIVDELSDNTEHLVMISSGNVGAAPAFTGERAKNYERLTREFKTMFAKVAAETKLEYVDLFIEPEVDPFVLEPENYFSIDRLHPSDEGYGVWYQTLYPTVEKALSE